MAYLTPLVGGRAASAAFVVRCLDRLAAEGYSKVVTTALGPLEQAGFLEVGFQVEERLRVLAHDLDGLPPWPSLDESSYGLRRAWPADRAHVLTVDHRAFAPFWQLDQAGLDEALDATPHSRFRVVVSTAGAEVVGYSVTGRAGRRGFVQRLAVHPEHHGHRLGRVLVLDGLRWLRRWRVERAVVNTQLDNVAALGLYQSVGFRPDDAGLSVLSVGLGR